MQETTIILVLLIVLIIGLISVISIILIDPHTVTMKVSKWYTGIDRISVIDAIYELENDHTNTDFTQFFIACSFGNIEKVFDILHFHPKYLNQHSVESGETCLHIAVVHDKYQLIGKLIQAGANPNVRSRFELGNGHRMTPLAWGVLHGHINSVRVLLEHSLTKQKSSTINIESEESDNNNNNNNNSDKIIPIDINMDVDCMHIAGKKVTVLDLVYRGLPHDHNNDDHIPVIDGTNIRRETFYQMKDLLLQYGAKTYDEIIAAEEEAMGSKDEL